MAEQRKPAKPGAEGKGARPMGLQRKSGRAFRSVQSTRTKGAVRAESGHAATGRVQVRRDEAAYARTAGEHGQHIRSEIQAAVDAASRVRAGIEAKIDKQLHHLKKRQPKAEIGEQRGGQRREDSRHKHS